MREMLELWAQYKEDVGVVGLAGEYQRVVQGSTKTFPEDEFTDPYAWIKYIGRPGITPKHLAGIVPS
jgi:hypothetical protein